MEYNIFTIWFFISPFIILHQYLKNKEYKEKASSVVEHINDVWDKDYKQIITTYGTVENFLDCHSKDFDIMRSNIAKIYHDISFINRDYMSKTEKIIKMIEQKEISEDEILQAIILVRRSICEQTDEQLTWINSFLVDEENAHSSCKKVIDVLDAIDEKYKNNNIYREVNKD